MSIICFSVYSDVRIWLTVFIKILFISLPSFQIPRYPDISNYQFPKYYFNNYFFQVSWYLDTLMNISFKISCIRYFYSLSIVQIFWCLDTFPKILSEVSLLSHTLYPCCFGVEWVWPLPVRLFSPAEPPHCAGSRSPRVNRDCVKASLCTRSHSCTNTSCSVLLWVNNFCSTPL